MIKGTYVQDGSKINLTFHYFVSFLFNSLRFFFIIKHLFNIY